jgi:hypothetical protein
MPVAFSRSLRSGSGAETSRSRHRDALIRHRAMIIDQKKAVGIAVRGEAAKPRWTKLREWLGTD